MLLYSLLHLTGVKAVSKDYEPLGELSVPLEAIKSFRQLASRCPGHPEYRWTSGVETTTGPLGQGVANSVGMAAAGKWVAARFNKPGFEDLINFNVYAQCGDGYCYAQTCEGPGGCVPLGAAPLTVFTTFAWPRCLFVYVHVTFSPAATTKVALPVVVTPVLSVSEQRILVRSQPLGTVSVVE